MIIVLHTDSFVSYNPRYHINNMKAKLSDKSLFGDSDRCEIRGGERYSKAAPNKSQKYLSQMVSGGHSSLFFFSSTHLEY